MLVSSLLLMVAAAVELIEALMQKLRSRIYS